MDRVILLLPLMVTLLSFPTTKADYLSHTCSNTTVFTPNSTFQTNLNNLLSALSSNATRNTGFYNATAGRSETVYGLFLCRGDVTTAVCKTCVTNATSYVFQYCPVETDVVIWYDYCMLRYSNMSFFSVVDVSIIGSHMWDTPQVSSEANRFNQVLGATFTEVTKEAVNDVDKFATRKAYFMPFMDLYTLVQCTQDLSSSDCETCLAKVIARLPGCCVGRLGVRILHPSCFIRYEVYPFYYSTEAAAPSPPPGSDTRELVGPKSDKAVIILTRIVIPVALIISLIILLHVCLKVRNKRQEEQQIRLPAAEEENDEITFADSLQFEFETIRVATNNFSEENKLGQGGFGYVYKGTLLNGEDIAVKRLSTNSGQGDLEFKNEVLLVAKLQHRNLVKLLGFCLERNERLLVYEFVPNTSLDHIIFDRIRCEQFDWDMRYKIILGITRGLLYLHEDSRLRIIHRDLKASNILIDAQMNPKISDFGMAKLFVVDQTQGNTSRIVGTFGYMAPEYAMHGQFSAKSDVYSFGVLVLEMVSGQKNNCFRQGENVEDLLSYAWKSWREGTASDLVDPALRNYSRTELMRCIHIGLLCVQENIADRPTMSSITLMLNSYSLSLPLPSQPAFFMHSDIGPIGPMSGSSGRSKSNSAKASDNEVSYSELYPR